MPIDIDGITYEQPGDKATATYAQVDGVLGYIGNAGKRVVKSELSPDGHNHDGEWIYPVHILRPDSGSQLTLNGRAGNYLQFLDTGLTRLYVPTTKSFDVLGWFRVLAVVTHPYSFEITGTPNYRTAIADAWYLYASSVADKEDIEEITNPIQKIKNLRGLTYTRDGLADTGIVVEDLDKTGLPGIVRKVASKIEAWNPIPIIGLLIASVKELVARVEALEAKVIK